MTQQSRRRNPYPWTWELPVGIGLSLLTLLVVGAHLGRAVANLVAGGGWAFPAPTDLFTSLPGLLAGDAQAGLHPPAEAVASPSPLAVWIAATELVLLVGVVLLLKVGLGRWGPSRVKGVASRAEAERLLGPARLRQVRGVIRPDLYPQPRHHR